MAARVMARPELHRTLVAAVEAVSPPADAGMVVTEVELVLPLELMAGSRRGRPVIGGTVPHTRWRSGVMPEVHAARLRIELVPDQPAIPARRRGV